MNTTEFDVQKIDDELLNSFRSNLNYYDSLNRVVDTILPTITTTTSDIYFVSAKMNYIKTVELDGNELKFGKDYIIHWRDTNKGSIELLQAPTAGQELDIVYGLVGANGSFIYPDLPRNDISLGKLPRIGFRTNYTRELVGGDGLNIAVNNPGLLQVKIIAESTSEINKLITALDSFIFNNFKKFYYIRYIDPSTIGNYDNFSDNTDKPFQKILEYNMPHKYQVK